MEWLPAINSLGHNALIAIRDTPLSNYSMAMVESEIHMSFITSQPLDQLLDHSGKKPATYGINGSTLQMYLFNFTYRYKRI